MARLEVTNVVIRPFTSDDLKLRAFATIVLNECFVVRDLKVIEGTGGQFVAMPSRKGKDGAFHDIAHPVNQETRDAIEQAVLEAYKKFGSRHPADYHAIDVGTMDAGLT